jgi:hypothetical protein
MPRVILLICLAACGPYYLESGGHVTVVGTAVVPPPGGSVYSDDLGDGLVQAVAKNPSAADSARVYRHRQRWGFLLSMIGLGCGGVDLGFAAANEGPMGTPKGALKAELGVGVGCLAVTAVGLGMALSGNAYANDAIGLYNQYPVAAQLR